MSVRRETIEVSDEAGQATQLIRVIPRIQAPSLSGTTYLDGLAEIFTLDGERVNHLGSGLYETVTTRRRFQST